MINSLLNLNGIFINDSLVYDYILYGNYRVTKMKREVFSENSKFLIHYGVTTNTFTDDELVSYSREYITLITKMVFSRFNSVLPLRIKIVMRLSIYFPLLTKFSYSISNNYYRLARRLFLHKHINK